MALIDEQDGIYDIIPLLGLPAKYQGILFDTAFPQVFYFICIFIFPILFTPIFMKLKGVIMRKYENGYLNIEDDSIDLKKFFSRGIFSFLLTLGLLSTILNLNIIDLTLYVPEDYFSWGGTVEGIKYKPEVYTQLFFTVAPFVVGIWSIGWIIEDAGLIHFNLPSRDSKLFFEIEPAHMKYNSILKGYAGISALIYYIETILNIVSETGMENLLVSITLIISMIFSIGLSYLFYLKVTKPLATKILRKSLKEVDRITEMTYK